MLCWLRNWLACCANLMTWFSLSFPRKRATRSRAQSLRRAMPDATNLRKRNPSVGADFEKRYTSQRFRAFERECCFVEVAHVRTLIVCPCFHDGSHFSAAPGRQASPTGWWSAGRGEPERTHRSGRRPRQSPRTGKDFRGSEQPRSYRVERRPFRLCSDLWKFRGRQARNGRQHH